MDSTTAQAMPSPAASPAGRSGGGLKRGFDIVLSSVALLIIGVPLLIVIFVAWGIAFVEYCFAVPANRYGHAVYSAAELKTMQEVITLTVFAAFSVLYLGERITSNHLVGFAMICGGAFFIFKGPLPSW